MILSGKKLYFIPMKNGDDWGSTSQDTMEEEGNCIEEAANQPHNSSSSSLIHSSDIVNSFDDMMETPASPVRPGPASDLRPMSILSSAQNVSGKGKSASFAKCRKRRRRHYKLLIAGLLLLMVILLAIVIAVRIATKTLIKTMKSYNNSSMPISEGNEADMENAYSDDSSGSIWAPSIVDDDVDANPNKNMATPATVKNESPGSTSSPLHTVSDLNLDIGEEVVISEDSIEVLALATPTNTNSIESSVSIPTPGHNIGSDINPDTGEEVEVYQNLVDAISTVSPITDMPIENEAPVTSVIHDNSNESVSTSIISTASNKRKIQWLQAHNYRRKQWHQRSGVSYVPLRWSSGLASHAFVWAKQLIRAKYEDIALHHEEGVEQGENLAMNCGTGSWGEMYTPDEIVERWVEEEENLLPPYNLHLTQVLWRATTYVGCAESKRKYDNGKTCHIQVCRYVKVGNCNMGHYNETEWMIPMLLDDSVCGTDCPPEGCF